MTCGLAIEYNPSVKSKDYKKAFFGDQYKEIEENNRMGKTRALFKKIRDTKGKRYKMARIHRRTVQKRSSRPR